MYSQSQHRRGGRSLAFSNLSWQRKLLTPSARHQSDSSALFVKRLQKDALYSRYFVSKEELRRRCSPPESFSANSIVAYVRKAKSKKQEIEQKLKESAVQPSKRTKVTSLCSKLTEGECVDLAEDIGHLATRTIPFDEVGKSLVEKNKGDVPGSISETEFRTTMKEMKKTLETV
ncbi:hypothetical protein UPYG_G00267920 [Umbra pygmaea]|uniref:Transcription factor AP-2 C-terminal domain-containing protein n=1 Tax=Umbra pygmaea TaxID=75934 RepID=A0ABD0X0N4_UMBPY